jgi:thiamine biosynthesis protein ThiS
MIEILVNGESRRIESGATLESLLAELKLTPRLVAIEVNRELVPRAEHPRRKLRPGDQLEIVSLAGGG